MKYYIIAGEASGDLHGANLMREIKRKDPTAEFRFWGGDLMNDQDPNLVKHYRDLAFMGFVEVLSNLRTIFRNIDFCKKDVMSYKPDVVILIDYPGFNLRVAEYFKEQGLRVFYYISPQIWAWKQNRVHKIKRVVDRMFVILPFEKEFYSRFNYEVDFVGHPLLDAIHNNQSDKLDSKNQVIALLPGSRKQEISKMLPLMLSAAKEFKDFDFVIAGAPSIEREYYEPYLNDHVKIVYNKTYSLLKTASAALVTSGTATLETALFNVPEVVCYKANKISYHIARKLIKVKYISLVNLIMDKEIVKELIQDDLNPENIKVELEKLLYDQKYRHNLFDNYSQLQQVLGGGGASAKTAELMMDYLKN